MDMDAIMANAHNMVLAYYLNGARIPDDTWAGFHSHHVKHGKAFPLRIVSWSWALAILSPT
jgi:hypothetical protein